MDNKIIVLGLGLIVLLCTESNMYAATEHITPQAGLAPAAQRAAEDLAKAIYSGQLQDVKPHQDLLAYYLLSAAINRIRTIDQTVQKTLISLGDRSLEKLESKEGCLFKQFIQDQINELMIPLHALKVSEQGKALINQQAGRIEDFRIFNGATDYDLAHIASFIPTDDLASLAATSPSGYQAATRELSLRPVTFMAHNGPVAGVFVANDGSVISVGHEDKLIKVWDEKYKIVKDIVLNTNSPVKKALFSPCSNKLALAHANGVIAIWDIQSGQKLYQCENVPVEYWALSADGNILALSIDQRVYQPEYENMIHVLNLQDFREIKCISDFKRGPKGRIVSLAFSPDGMKLAVSQARGQITFWGTDTFEKIDELIINSYLALSFLSDGRLMGSSVNTCMSVADIHLFDISNQKEIANGFKISEIGSFITAIFSPNGSLFAIGFTELTVILDINTGNIRKFQNQSPVLSLAFSPDTSTLVAGYKDGSIVIRKVKLSE